ncbi:hypothetical protein FCOIX_5775 [Fusarium coicis]|nr:hypothetical protein FCOIX_5775 [Fusarium coicis]
MSLLQMTRLVVKRRLSTDASLLNEKDVHMQSAAGTVAVRRRRHRYAQPQLVANQGLGVASSAEQYAEMPSFHPGNNALRIDVFRSYE